MALKLPQKPNSNWPKQERKFFGSCNFKVHRHIWLQAKLDPDPPDRLLWVSPSPSLTFVILSVGTIVKGLPHMVARQPSAAPIQQLYRKSVSRPVYPGGPRTDVQCNPQWLIDSTCVTYPLLSSHGQKDTVPLLVRTASQDHSWNQKVKSDLHKFHDWV